MSDKEIIERLRRGDESGLKFLYEHKDMVLAWVKKNNGNDADAHDLFQEAMMVFYKNVLSNKYEHKAKISTYLFGICKRQWLNQINRRLKYERPTDIKNEKYEYVMESKDEEMNDDQNNYIKQLLNSLGEPCKSLLVASICYDMKMKNIAIKFAYKNAHSARQRKLRCLKTLRGGFDVNIFSKLQ